MTFITETDWWAFGDGVATALEHIDWATVANRLFAVIGAALGGIGAIIGGLISDGVVAAKEYFQDKIEECGGNVVDGIFKGVIDAMKAVGTWIKTNSSSLSWMHSRRLWHTQPINGNGRDGPVPVGWFL